MEDKVEVRKIGSWAKDKENGEKITRKETENEETIRAERGRRRRGRENKKEGRKEGMKEGRKEGTYTKDLKQ